MTIAERWGGFWRSPDPRMRDAGARGEVAVARIRLAAVLLLGLIPVSASLRSGATHDLAGLAILAVAAVSAALVIRAALSRRWPRLGLTTGLLDVTLISLALAVYLVLGRPWLALNSRVTFLIYFLAIAATALRYDHRLCILVGGVAIAEYLAVVFAATRGWDVHSAAFETAGYGRFEWSAQLNRVLLLAIATMFSVAIVRRTQRLLVATGVYEQRLAELSRRLMAAQEEERGRLSRELHDELGQSMTALKLRLLGLSRNVGSEDLRAQVGGSLEIVQDAMARVRDLAQALRPPLLDDLGLETAVRWQAERMAKDAGFTVVVEARGLPSTLSPERTTACFRVAQEALTNVARHAQARAVRIELVSAERELRLTVTDDGRGFDVAAGFAGVTAGKSMGLVGMQQRVRLLGGRFRITSQPGHGTVIEVALPMSADLPASVATGQLS